MKHIKAIYLLFTLLIGVVLGFYYNVYIDHLNAKSLKEYKYSLYMACADGVWYSAYDLTGKRSISVKSLNKCVRDYY
jgi:hypothetical protein